MKAIGGYFELELGGGGHYHADAVRLNSGRHAFEYVLRSKRYRRVYIPAYSCASLLEPIERLGIEHRLYGIDKTCLANQIARTSSYKEHTKA